MINKQLITQAAQEWLTGKDYFLVDINITPDNKITVEIDNQDGVWIEDCANLSQHIESHLNRNTEDYELEVGSAGINKPFKVTQQYTSHIGQNIETLTKDGHKIKGILTHADNHTFTILPTIHKKKQQQNNTQPITLNYNEVKYTKPHINFELE